MDKSNKERVVWETQVSLPVAASTLQARPGLRRLSEQMRQEYLPRLESRSSFSNAHSSVRNGLIENLSTPPPKKE